VPVTERLYYTDSLLREFTARIVGRRATDRGPAVVLDRTAFYPTSGGQPHDMGALDGARVLDVWDEDDGAVWHLVDRLPDGDTVRGVIDWERRFDHMQQHSGQHLLSAAFVRLLDAPTISFHLGTDASHIDLDTAAVSWDDAFRVEADVNRVISENRPVEIHFVDERNIGDVPLRRPPKVSGEIRVIWIRDYDAVACGGTHVPQTGAVGLLKIVRLERYKGGMRVGFLCGGRALADYQRVLRDLQAVSTDLSVHASEVGEAVTRLKADLKEARRALQAAEGAALTGEAERLWQETPEQDGVRRLVAHLADRPFEHARALAARAITHPHTLALLAASDAKGIRLVCVRAADLTEVDAAAILRRATERLGGQGGGRADQAQGGAPARPPDVILAALHDAVLPRDSR
jgi:alanyl-tRNA synthetase